MFAYSFDTDGKPIYIDCILIGKKYSNLHCLVIDGITCASCGGTATSEQIGPVSLGWSILVWGESRKIFQSLDRLIFDRMRLTDANWSRFPKVLNVVHVSKARKIAELENSLRKSSKQLIGRKTSRCLIFRDRAVALYLVSRMPAFAVCAKNELEKSSS